jgi:hypothetical protein
LLSGENDLLGGSWLHQNRGSTSQANSQSHSINQLQTNSADGQGIWLSNVVGYADVSKVRDSIEE